MNWTRRKADNGFDSLHHVLTLNNGDEILLWRKESKYGATIYGCFPDSLSRIFHVPSWEWVIVGRTIRDTKKRVEAYVDYMRGV